MHADTLGYPATHLPFQGRRWAQLGLLVDQSEGEPELKPRKQHHLFSKIMVMCATYVPSVLVVEDQEAASSTRVSSVLLRCTA